MEPAENPQEYLPNQPPASNTPTAPYQRCRLRVPWLHSLDRCAICTNRLGTRIVLLEEVGVAPSPQQHWLLCLQCDAAVQHELLRADLHSPQRVRIAVGMVAGETSHTYRRLSAEDMEEKWVERGLIGLFVLAFAVHILAFLVVVIDLVLTH